MTSGLRAQDEKKREEAVRKRLPNLVLRCRHDHWLTGEVIIESRKREAEPE